MADLLLELFSEEIPARMQEAALEYLQEKLRLAFGKQVKGFATPRRLAVIINELPAVEPDVTNELKGPKIGAPEAALQGFLKKNNLTQKDLVERDGVYFATTHQKGRSTAVALKTTIEHLLASFPWPKSMRWGSGDTTWVRPLHSILCIFDGKIVPVEFAGIAAGNTTRGHRFLSPGTITITNPSDYESALEKSFVIADREKRKASILEQAEKTAGARKLQLKKDDGLLEEVTGLVEYPVVLAGRIDAKFMDLPKEVLVSEMRAHQKYFALENKDGTLSDTFLITSNMKTTDDGEAVISGNERVLRARLSDGRFFWDQDRKKSLDEWADGLKTVTFHAKLGSVAAKVERIKSLALQLSEHVNGANKKLVERAADLCKADLVTGMVGEFPELQGVMGRYYAQSKENAVVADAIRDHYKPQGSADSTPKEPVAICVALADKLDTLISMFAIDEKPTGSKDPFALRRAALGVIRIILENNIRLPLKNIFKTIPDKEIASLKAHEKLAKKVEADLQHASKIGKYQTINETAYEDVDDAVAPNLSATLYEFFIDRLKVQLKDSGIRHDVINAVVANGDDDLVRIVERAKALQDFLGTEDGANLLAAYKRASNILAIEEKKDKTTYNKPVQFDEFKLKEEQVLKQALAHTANGVLSMIDQEKFREVMSAFSKLRAPVDLFFDKILVNDKDAKTRELRLNLLSELKQTFDSIANFALIEGESKEQKKAA